MLILIRHAEDIEKLGHYAGLTTNGKIEAIMLGKFLIEKFGIPNKIYITPFYRGKQTANMLLNTLNSTFIKNIKIKTSTYLSRYTKYDGQISISIPEHETKYDVKNRVKYFLNKHKKHANNVIWCVTHAIVVKYAAKILNLNPNKHIKFLEYYVKY